MINFNKFIVQATMLVLGIAINIIICHNSTMYSQIIIFLFKIRACLKHEMVKWRNDEMAKWWNDMCQSSKVVILENWND